MSVRHVARTLIVTACALSLAFVSTAGGAAQQKVETLEARMDRIQEELDEATARIEDLLTREDDLRLEMAVTGLEMDRIERRQAAVAERVEAIARDLYMGGDDSTLETLLGSEDLGELTSRLEYVEAVGEENARVMIGQARVEEQLVDKRDELEEQIAELTDLEDTLESESQRLQAQFLAASDEYEALKEKLAREAAKREAARRSALAPDLDGGPPPRPGPGGFYCPIDGPNSFIDSWGFPRSGGRSHEGTDVMAAFDTPVVAITDGTITYAGVGSMSGNWVVLTSDNGDQYMYMHNKRNLKTSGRVEAGESIATVGDSGNAIGGPPHVHFEFHPGGSGPVNPFPLLDGIC